MAYIGNQILKLVTQGHSQILYFSGPSILLCHKIWINDL